MPFRPCNTNICQKSIDNLITITEEAFASMGCTTLNDVFLSYHLAMENAMKVGGGNNYQLQHIGKTKL
eukprot:9282269-Ditylum_brightwellii.AAC.1